MRDLNEAIRDAVNRNEPPADWLERVRARVRRKRRNQRLRAAAVGLGLSLVVIVSLARELATSDSTPSVVPGSAAAPAPCGISTPFTGWWRWEGSGADEVAGRDANLQGDARFAPGMVGQALTLDGHGDFAAVPDDPSLDVGTGDFTVAMWVRFRTTDREQVLAEDYVETFDRATSTGWTLTKLKNNVIRFGLGRAGGVDTEPLNLPRDTWIQIAARREGDIVSIFKNGKEIATGTLRYPSLTVDSDSSLKFGHRGGREDTPGSLDNRGFFLNGQLDEIKFVVGRALPDEEIRSLFERRSACTP